MDFDFSVFNPAHYPRLGHVALSGSDIPPHFSGSTTGLVLHQHCSWGPQECPVQLDRLDPADPNSHVLSFYLADPVPTGAATRMTLGTTDSPAESRNWHFPESSPERFDLYNDRVFVSFSLAPQPDSWGPCCFAGSAQSVRVRDTELLDSFTFDWTQHDPQKRCMQIDMISHAGAEHYLYDKPYQLISLCTGPVRTVATMAQSLFHEGRECCKLFRILSHFRDAGYILEEIYVVGAGGEPLAFSPRYYADIDMQQDLSWFKEQDDELPPHLARNAAAWLAIHCPYGDPERQRPGYGFASDGELMTIKYPHDPRRERSYSWSLRERPKFQCLHLFLRADDAPHQTGVAWFEQIYSPLRIAL